MREQPCSPIGGTYGTSTNLVQIYGNLPASSQVPNLTNNQLAQVAASGIPQFTYEQYNQIMQMLGKGNENSGLPMTTGMAHHVTLSEDKLKWIIDMNF